MESYWAKIENGKVISVEVVSDDFVAANPKRYSGLWKKVGTESQPFVGREAIYLPEKDKIVGPKPFESWILDLNDKWIAPKIAPVDIEKYYWDENIKDWVKKI